MRKSDFQLEAVGWREWISFPDWGIDYIKVKVDTGARTSALHVGKAEYFENETGLWIRFNVYPWQESRLDKKTVTAPVISYKEVKSSSGFLEKRPVIRAKLSIKGKEIETDITLTNRSQMGFRMLLGRESISKQFCVVPGRSFLGGKPPENILMKNKEKTGTHKSEVKK